MDNIKNTILKNNPNGKLNTTSLKFSKFLKVDHRNVYNILDALSIDEFLSYTEDNDILSIQIINKENFKFEKQQVVKDNIIICVSCRYCYNKRYASKVVKGVKFKRVTCFCGYEERPVSAMAECKRYENKYYR